MNANSLAIIFAPCILRTNKPRQAQESLLDVSRETLCIETIITEQLKKVKATLSNIESVDSAALSFSVRLNSIRSSKVRISISKKAVLFAGNCSSEFEFYYYFSSLLDEKLSAVPLVVVATPLNFRLRQKL